MDFEAAEAGYWDESHGDLDQALSEVDPAQLATTILRQHKDDPAWLDALFDGLSCGRSGYQLGYVLKVWGLSQAEFGVLLGVSRQAVGKWMVQIPADRAVDIANLVAATDVLTHHLKHDRIPAVVRRPAAALDNQSLVDLVATGDTSRVVAACRQMFDFASISG